MNAAAALLQQVNQNAARVMVVLDAIGAAIVCLNFDALAVSLGVPYVDSHFGVPKWVMGNVTDLRSDASYIKSCQAAFEARG